MKCVVASLLVVAAAVTLGAARHSGYVFKYDAEDYNHKHYQKGETGEKVTGQYSWISPEGYEDYVKHIADEDGYRVMESNALPVSSWGAEPDGIQGSIRGDDEVVALDVAH